jgi:hypothetical protein
VPRARELTERVIGLAIDIDRNRRGVARTYKVHVMNGGTQADRTNSVFDLRSSTKLS